MGCHWTGLVFGRVYESTEEHEAITERLLDNHTGLRRAYECETPWMGFAVAITDAAANDDEDVDYVAVRVDEVATLYAERIAVARERWDRLRVTAKERYGVDVGEGSLLFVSDYR
jgi:hypothetical protein